MNVRRTRRFWTFFLALAVVLNILTAASSAIMEFDLFEDQGWFSFLIEKDTTEQFLLQLWVTLLALLITTVSYLLSLFAEYRPRPLKRLALLIFSAALIGAAWLYTPLTDALEEPYLVIIVGVLLFLAPFFLLLLLERLAGLAFYGMASGVVGLGRWPAACRLLRITCAFTPHKRAARKQLGMVWYHLGVHENSLPLLRESFEEGETDAELLAALLETLDCAEPELAIKVTRKLIHQRPNSKKLIDNLIVLYRQTGQNKQAMKLIDRHYGLETVEEIWRAEEVIAEEGDVSRALELIAKAVALEGRALAEARRRTSALLNTYPDHTDILRVAADLAQRGNDAAQAIAQLEHLCILSPKDAPARINLIHLYHKNGRVDEALPHYRVLFNQAPPTPELRIEYIEALESLGRQEEALAEIREACQEPEDDPHLLKLGASLLHDSGELDEALSFVERGRKRAKGLPVEQDFASLSTAMNRAIIERKIAELDQRRQTEPHNLELFFEYIDQLSERGYFNRMVTELDALLHEQEDVKERLLTELRRLADKADPAYETMSYLADLLQREGDADGTLELFRKMSAQSINPDNVLKEGCLQVLRIASGHYQAHLTLAQIAEKEKNWSEVVEHLHACEEADEAAAKSQLFSMFKAYYELDQLEQCRTYGQAAIEAGPHELDRRLILIDILMRHEQYQEALSALKSARKIAPVDRDLISLQREAREKNRANRLTELRDLLDKNPAAADLQLEMGNLLIEVEQYQEAIPHFDRAKSSPDLANLSRAKIALCLGFRQLFELAQETAEEIDWEREGEKHYAEIKALIYDVASIFEQDQLWEAAHAFYKKVFKLDAGYRNVVEKIEKLTLRLARRPTRGVQ